MRKIVAGLAITLDGVVESPSDWLRPNDEMQEIIAAGLGRSDAILLGRDTYLDFAAMWPSLDSSAPMAHFMNNTPKYVISSTITSTPWAHSAVLSGDLTTEVTQLKSQPGKDIQMPGSPRLVRSLIELGLLDELSLMIHPIVLGDGLRLFDTTTERLELNLINSKPLSTGVIAATYQPITA